MASKGGKSNNAANNPIQLVVRVQDGWRLYKQNPRSGKLQIQSSTKPCNDADIVFSPDGQFFAVLLEAGIEIYESNRGRKLFFLEHYRVRNVYFSPSNTFLVSYHHRRNGDKKGNCWVWKWSSGSPPGGGVSEGKENAEPSKEDKGSPSSSKSSSSSSSGNGTPGTGMKVVFHFFLPEFDKKRVPLQFSNDEMIAARVSRNAVIVHDAQRLQYKSNNVLGKLDVPQAAAVVVAPCRKPRPQKQRKYAAHEDPDAQKEKAKGGPQSSYLLATFAVPKSTGKAATVCIYEFQYSMAMSGNKTGSKPFNRISQRAFMGVDSCELLWCPSKSYHHNLLAVASSDVDTSGKSYYGHQTLYLLSSRNSMTTRIPIAEKGKMQDVQWHPSGREFVMIDDHPQKITVFDNRGNTVADLGRYARNLIRFSPDGRFLWLGGFGNLTGEMTFYDYRMVKDPQQKGKCLGYGTDDACRYFQWSPDASSLVTARLHPFMTVDNGFKIYRYNGEKIHDETFDRLYQVTYRPSAPNTYPSRSPSPKAKKGIRSLPTPQEKKRWIPPHKRAALKAQGKAAVQSTVPPKKQTVPKPQIPQQPVGGSRQPHPQHAPHGQYHQNAPRGGSSYPPHGQQQQHGQYPAHQQQARQPPAHHQQYQQYQQHPQGYQQQQPHGQSAPTHYGRHQQQQYPTTNYQQHSNQYAPTAAAHTQSQSVGYYNQSHGGQGHYAQQQQQQQHSVSGMEQQMQQMNIQSNTGNGNGSGSGDISVNTNLNGNGDAVDGNDANGQFPPLAGGKKKRRRRKKKNSPANGNPQNEEEKNFGSGNNSYASNPFKPGLHDNKRWNRGSKYQG